MPYQPAIPASSSCTQYTSSLLYSELAGAAPATVRFSYRFLFTVSVAHRLADFGLRLYDMKQTSTSAAAASGTTSAAGSSSAAASGSRVSGVNNAAAAAPTASSAFGAASHGKTVAGAFAGLAGVFAIAFLAM
ncbi:hypothetical protein P389DRAFT_93384 [Cystobasidium minutum MCA 4210]|uniref:uncharacterized protein n=1 Tax=Cystobasidium minutum MCA 4210 TaxID=1397322 RepID=UPI0034D00B0C|eukprot:jgi/Rhomi1/93384/CE93383_732